MLVRLDYVVNFSQLILYNDWDADYCLRHTNLVLCHFCVNATYQHTARLIRIVSLYEFWTPDLKL